MSKLTFTKERARALADFYSTRDLQAQRAATMQKLAIQKGDVIIDIGSGPGFLSKDLADATGPRGSVLGVDISEDLVAFCQRKFAVEGLSFKVADATALPTQSGQFDVAVCTQVAEYIPDVERVLSEIYRVLKPEGRALVVATDWSTVSWNSEKPKRMAQVMQAWNAHCAHSDLPPKLAPLLQDTGFEITDVDMFPLVNVRYDSQAYSFGISKLIRDFVVDGSHIGESQADAWLAELASLDEAGHYYFTSGRMMFSVYKPA